MVGGNDWYNMGADDDPPMANELLLMLQDLRLSLPDVVTSAMLFVSSPIFYIGLPMTFAIFIFICVDKRSGEWMVMNLSVASFVGHFLKDIIANPRPWITDERITPDERALKGAKGYSTPSGHSIDSTAGFGSVIAIFRRRWVTVLFIVIILTVMFSRLYLGVHTPLDIATGTLTAIFVIIINRALLKTSYSDEHSYLMISVIYALAFVTITLLWILVTKNVNAVLKFGGLLLGAMIGRVIEHRFIGYEVKSVPMGKNICRLFIGLMIVGLSLIVPYALINNSLSNSLGGFLAMIGLFVIAPMMIEKIGLND